MSEYIPSPDSLPVAYGLLGGLLVAAALAAVWLVNANRDSKGVSAAPALDDDNWLTPDGLPENGSRPSSPFL